MTKKSEMIIKILVATKQSFDWDKIERIEKMNIRAIWHDYHLLKRLGMIN